MICESLFLEEAGLCYPEDRSGIFMRPGVFNRFFTSSDDERGEGSSGEGGVIL